MPNGRTHRRLGAATGGVAALYHARDQPPGAMLVETVGGLCGGLLGGMLPDRLDLPVSPRHRGACHSLVLLVLIAVMVLEEQRQEFRERGRRAQGLAHTGIQPALASAGWLFAAGFISGMQWGYVSHLAADMTTTAGLPLLMKGF